MKENFPNLVREIDMQVQEAQRVSNTTDVKMLTPRHIIIKMPRLKRWEGGYRRMGEEVRGLRSTNK